MAEEPVAPPPLETLRVVGASRSWVAAVVLGGCAEQALGAWCIYSSSGHADVKLLLGWWVLLMPGTLIGAAVTSTYAVDQQVVIAAASNVAVWLLVFLAARKFRCRRPVR